MFILDFWDIKILSKAIKMNPEPRYIDVDYDEFYVQ